ncbi:MAG: copper chaperone PCu(A)C [Rhodocyclaceae bacterium]|nr:copper chaperone PCu(A)C [Rhodocyclaceae bacterium]
MRKLLVALNALLVFAILGVAFYWNPQPEEVPLPGTYAARLGHDVADPQPASGRPAAEIGVVDPYVALMPPGIRITAAYLTLRNSGDRDVRLVAASCPSASVAELHTHIDDKGVMRMRQVKEIVVPAKGEVQLRPGGYHVMLIDMKTPLKEGDKLAITLAFGDGSSKTIEAPAKVGTPPHMGTASQ